jgi:N-acetylneuraminic acid mutarotase
MEVYDPVLNTWTQEAPMPIGCDYSVVASCQNLIYVIGYGFSSTLSTYSVNEAYDPITNTWENKTPPPQLTSYAQANVVNGEIFIIGGAGGGLGISATNWVYTPWNDSWSQMAPLPIAVSSYGSVVLDNKIYIFGGSYEAEIPYYFPTNIVQIFDPATDQWSQGTPMPYNMSVMTQG